jgi:hypothetical protein
VAVVATSKSPIAGTNIAANLDTDSFTATTFRIRAFKPNGSAYANLAVTFSYAAYAGAVPTTTPPTPTTVIPTTPLPTTTAPPTGGFPDAGNTGVPAGTSLTVVNGDFETTSNNQVIDAQDVRGWLIVRHTGVHITRSRMQILDLRGSNNTLVEDSEIEPSPTGYQMSNFPPTFVDDNAAWTLRRVEVRGWQDGPRTAGGTVLIEDSLLHDLAFASGEHPDGYQQYCPGCDSDVTLHHNTISGCTGNSSDKGSSAMFWSDHPGAGSTLDVGNNLFSCGQFSIRVNDALNGAGVKVNVHDNQVVRGSYAFGATECDNSAAWNGTDGVQWTNNTYSDNGQQIPTAC